MGKKLLENALNKRGRLLAVLMTAVMLFSSVSNGAEAATKKLKVTSPKTVAVNSSIKIKTNIKCSFKSSNKKIATVNSNGVVKGKKAGSVKITVTAKKSKQKKTVKITVKKTKVVVTKTPSTAAPKVNATQPPSITETVTPPTDMANPSPINSSVAPPTNTESSLPTNTPVAPPTSTSNPSTTSPPVVPPTSTSNPSTTSPPVVPPTNTAKPSPTNSPVVPPTNTAKPSPTKPTVALPTNTVKPSTNPSATKQPIGITAEFEGKIPINWNLSGPLVAARMIGDTRIKIKLIYEDSEEEFVEWEKLEWVEDGNGVVEENGTKYSYKKLKLQDLQTTLKVELVEVPDDVLYPVDISCSYEGTALSETKMPDVKDIKTKALMIDGSYREISSTEIRIVRAKRLKSDKKYECDIVYDYYFEYNGEKLHATAGDILYIPYE